MGEPNKNMKCKVLTMGLDIVGLTVVEICEKCCDHLLTMFECLLLLPFFPNPLKNGTYLYHYVLM